MADWQPDNMATPAERQRAARIARYKAAYEAANGTPAPGVHYTGRRYRVGNMTSLTGPAMDRAIERLEERARLRGEAPDA